MASYDVICLIDTCVDFIVTGDTVPEFGQVEKCVDDYRLELGGSGSIFACQCARLGLRTAAVGAVGCDAFGDLFIAALRQAGVSDAYIRRDARLKTGVTAHLVHGSDRAMLTYTGTIDAVTPADVPDAVLGSARHLHISSYYLMRNMTPHFAELARRARALGMTVSLDTNWDPDQTWDGGLWETLRHTDYFLPNENELLRISGERDVEKALSALGCTVPFVTAKQGESGALLWARGRVLRAPSHAVPVADAIGAGDSFDAGFVWAALQGWPPETCLHAACICGSLNVRRAGGTAGQGDFREVSALLIERGVLPGKA
jgi:sugar/nucleoside kinase (ribokinase family)